MPERTVIAEIGGSSSRWAVLGGADTIILPHKGDRLLGFNPVSGDAQAFAADVRRCFGQHAPDGLQAERVIAYAAGCGSPARAAVMQRSLAGLWPQARIDVHSDLLGAARGLCGGQAGLVLILGTGMNAGWFDGRDLHLPMPSLGWALGDEGSGADIGRHFIQDAFYRRLPGDLAERLFGPTGPVLEEVIDRVYASPFPSRGLAAYTSLLAAHAGEPYVHDLVLSRFHVMAELLSVFFTPEQRNEVFATGSVAHGFREWLSECLLDRGMTLTVVEPDPLPGLVRLHRDARP